MELSDHLREMLKELGQAINESISGSDRVHDSLQKIRDEGYNLYMVLDAKVGVNRRERRESAERRDRTPRSSRRSLALVRSEDSEDRDLSTLTEERAAFRINLKDLRFLRSVGIDPTRKVRARRAPARKAAR
ncbi:MAG TPA: hypothetical protein VH854_05425 [Thermoanaerobaculia bacterium]|jgi:hypothetical protein|nr:hypothetical protein [Thermoanaerobaculia bacterium]